ncbi:MAG: zinc ribbon domain-containing protein [Candidatus Zixiibacteriota bacterium]
MEYKCQLLGLSLEKPLNPKGSSQYCPKCGRRGRHYVESNCKVERKSGGWFKCLHCGYQGDRDYVATQAFARKVLCGSFSTPNTKGISYMLRPAARLLRQSGRHVEKLAKVLNGWKHSCYLRPLRL